MKSCTSRCRRLPTCRLYLKAQMKSLTYNSYKPPAVFILRRLGRMFYRRETASYVSSHPIQITVLREGSVQ